jgi:protein-disulfide isomerase
MSKDPKSKSKPAKLTRTEERLRERQAAQRRRTIIIAVSSVVGVVALLLVVILLGNQPADAFVQEDAAAKYADLAQGTVPNSGYPRIGSLDGTVSVTLFSTFGCPNCKTFHEEIFPALLERVRANEIAITYAPLDVGSVINNGNGAARASICAQSQGIFWPYADALFDWMDRYGDQAFLFNRLVSGAENLGADAGQFRSCMGGDLPQRVLATARQDANGRQSSVIPPTVFVNNVAVEGGDLEAINVAIDAALALRQGFTPTPELESTPTEAPTLEPTAEPTDIPETEVPATDVPATAVPATDTPATDVPATTEPTAVTTPES